MPSHRSPTRLAALATALLGLGALVGCSSLTVLAGDGSVTVERRFGFLNVTPVPGRTPLVLRSTALGLQSGPFGQVVGYSSAEVTMLPPDDCRIVVIVEPGRPIPGEQLREWAQAGVCTAHANEPRSTP